MENQLFYDIVAVFVLSVFVLLVCHRLHIPSIVGLLLTGVLCGPSALSLVRDVESVKLLSEIGVVFLMFTIGMELSGSELARLKKPVFLGGTAQVGLCVVVFGALFLAVHGGTWQEGVFYGCLTALSSTAIVLSLHQQQGASEAPHGRMSLAILVFQDLAIVPMMIAIPLLAGKSGADADDLLLAAARTLGILIAGWMLAKYLVPRLMLQIVRTRSRELLVTSTLALCMVIAIGTAHLGLSLSLGAFIAGLLLSESEYSLNIIKDILPFKDVFTSLFFISVGMLLNVDFLAEHLASVTAWALAILALKALLIIQVVRLLGYPLRVGIMTGMSIGQIGEFSFVLASSGMAAGLIDNNTYQLFLAGSILTMSLTPVLMRLAPAVAEKVRAPVLVRRPGAPANTEDDSAVHLLRDHLIIVGYGVGGQHLSLTAKEAGIPYIILEMNPDTVTRFHKAGEPILHGDASSELVLDHVAVRQARVLAVVISDPAAVRAITATAHKLHPGLHIVVRTRFLTEVRELREIGATTVIPEDFETSMEIFTHVLEQYLVPRQTIELFVRRIRDEQFAMVRTLDWGGTHLESLNGHALGDVEVVACTVEEGAAVAGRALCDTALRSRYGVTVVGIRRGGDTLPSPDGNATLQPGDIAYLFGLPQALSPALAAFRAE